MNKINPADLIPMDIFAESEPITLDLVYAYAVHPRNIFDSAIYQAGARLWAHKDIAALTILTARKLYKAQGWRLELQDCLRTIEAQAAMQETAIVKAHPEWCVEGPNRMLSPPGLGAHPRGMAIDLAPLDAAGAKIDMGTPFDDMGVESARDYKNFPPHILENRQLLEQGFIESAKILNLPLYLVPSEWWDYRFPADHYNQFSPLSDADLPPQMQMTHKIDNGLKNFEDAHFQRVADSVLRMIEQNP